MGRRGIAIFLFISLALSIIPAVQNNYTKPIFATAQTVDTTLSPEQKRLINQTSLRIINANPGFVGNATTTTTSPAAAKPEMITALAQVIERIVVQTSNPDQIITHLAIEIAANPTGSLSQALLLFAKQLAAGDTGGVKQLASLITRLIEPSNVNATIQEDITGNISQLIMQQAFQSALGANQLLNQIASKLAANSSKLSVNNVTVSADAIAQTIQNIIIQVSLQQQVSFEPLLFIVNQVNQNPLGPLSKSIVQLAQLQITGGVGASQSITQSISELVKQITTGNITTLIGSVPTIEPTSSDGQDQDRRTKIIIRNDFDDEREPPIFQSPPPPPPEDQTPVLNENFTETQPPSPPELLQDNLTEPQPPVTNDTTLVPPPSPQQNVTVGANQTAQTNGSLVVQINVKKDDGVEFNPGDIGSTVDIYGRNSSHGQFVVQPQIQSFEGEYSFSLYPDRYYVNVSPGPSIASFLGNYTFSTDCGDSLFINAGDSISCSVIFDDISQLINGSRPGTGTLRINMQVINDDTNSTLEASDVLMDMAVYDYPDLNESRIYQIFKGSEEGITFTFAENQVYTLGVAFLPPTHDISASDDCNWAVIVAGANKTCTFTVDDRLEAVPHPPPPPQNVTVGANQTAQLRVITEVINDNGGNKTAEDFRIFLLDASETFTPGIIPAVPPPHGTILDKLPGTYIIVGSSLGNYVTTFEGDCDSTGRVTLALDGPPKSCTIIINDVDAALLKVITEVINDNGGNKTAEDFNIRILKANATTSADALRTSLVAGPIPGAPPPDGTIFDLAPGTYVVSGSPLFNYGTTFAGGCDSRARVTITVDDGSVCIIKFQDRLPGLVKAKVVTDVINDNGGNKTARDFRFDIVTPTVLFNGVSGSPPPDGRTFNMNAFSYTINPRADPGYTTTLQGDCIDVLVVENQTKTCTIRNNDIVADDGLLSPPPTPVIGNQTNATLVINTRVNNNDGVSVQPEDFGATVDVIGNNRTSLRGVVISQIPALDGGSDTFSVAPGSYTINVSPGPSIANFLGNYSFAIRGCPGPQVLNTGDTRTCFVIFDDIAQPTNGSQPVSTGTLSVNMHVINDNTNSTLESSDVFMVLKLGQIQQLFKGSEEGITFTLPANTSYFVFADQQSAHTMSRSGDCGGLAGFGGATILAGENKTCTITLDDTGGSAQIFSAGNASLVNLTGPSSTTLEKETICDDGIDNDNDIKVDTTDEDCFFASSSPTTEENATTTSLTPPTEPVQAPTQTQEQQQKQVEENNPPTADAGDDFSTESGNTVKLNGEASSDPDANQVLSYLWEQVSPDLPSVSLNGEKEEVASFKAPNIDEDTKFRFELTVKDGRGGEDTDSVTVAVLGSADEEEQKEEEEEEKVEKDEQETESLKREEPPADSSSDVTKE